MKFSKSKLALLYSLAVLVHAPKSVAAPVYSQVTPMDPIGAFASNDSLATSQRVADNFFIGGENPITIRSVRFIGGSGLSGPTLDNFRVVFFDDAGGSPGAPLSGGDFSIGPAFSRNPTGGQLLNGVTVPQEYVINLPNDITVNPNRPYWFSITNDILPVSGWVWARAEGTFDETIASVTDSIETGTWSTLVNGGMWFELSDHIVPEPSSLSLLIATLILTGWHGHAKTCGSLT